MDYSQDIFARLQNGETIEEIAKDLTSNLNKANEKFVAEQTAKREAEEKAKAEKVAKEQKIVAVENFLMAIADLLATYEVDGEFIDAIEDLNPEEVVDQIDQAIPFIQKYCELATMMEKSFPEVKKTAAAPASKLPIDPIDEFLNRCVR